MSLPTPYYDEDGITIFHGDCREILPHLPKVDLVLTDPPYGIGWVGNSESRAGLFKGKPNAPIIGDDKPFEPGHLIGLGKKHILWGANAYAGRLPSCYGWLVWDKRPNGERNTQSDAELAWTDFLGSVRTHRQRWMGCMRDGEECPFVGGALVHPTQKPISLLRWCILLAGESGSVLDPYVGSGSTLVAAKQLGRRAIGIELEEKYCEIAVQRLAQKVLPLAV